VVNQYPVSKFSTQKPLAAKASYDKFNMRTSIQLEYAKNKIKPKNNLTTNLDFNNQLHPQHPKYPKQKSTTQVEPQKPPKSKDDFINCVIIQDTRTINIAVSTQVHNLFHLHVDFMY
jgi:hypothetical protein